MDNMDDAETNAKISDSAYSNSCSNSQSRRSHSSKSTHSGSNSSGSSGYGGKASTSGSRIQKKPEPASSCDCKPLAVSKNKNRVPRNVASLDIAYPFLSNNLGQPPKKDKESKKKKLSQTEVKPTEVVPADVPITSAEPDPILATPIEESDNVVETVIALPELLAEEVNYTPDTEIAKIEVTKAPEPDTAIENYVTSRRPPHASEGFSCVISMHDGVVMYTSASITATLGFPKDVWVGRSFIDFVHPKDHEQFAALITNGLAFPSLGEGNHSTKETGLTSGTTMICRIRRYRSLYTAFRVKDVVVTFMPFLLQFFFKDYCNDDIKVIYLVIQATPFFSAFKASNELVLNQVPFVIRHTPSGNIDYVDPDSVPYLGYLPQDIKGHNVLNLYHADDLPYLRQIYEAIVKEGSVSNCQPYRFMVQNGCYIRVETEWSSVINPWSMKLQFVISKHRVIEGPTNPDVFQSPPEIRHEKTEAESYKTQTFVDSIIRIMNEVRTKPAEIAKGKQCQELVNFMETLIASNPKPNKEQDLDSPIYAEREFSSYERDSEMLGGISPHHDSDSKFSTETPLSYNQLNYNDNLQRYFDSQESQRFEVSSLANRIPTAESKDLYSLFKSCSPVGQKLDENETNSSASAIEIMIRSPPPPDSSLKKITESMMNKFMVQNGCYIRVETEWSSVINPWSMKLQFVISKHRVIEGPTNPDVFQSPPEIRHEKTEAESYKTQTFVDSIIRIMNEVRTKPAEIAMGKQCQELVNFMETLIASNPKPNKEQDLDSPIYAEREFSSYERDSEMLGGISPHHDSDSKFSTETPLSYNQLNYNDNLQRYFDSQESQRFEVSSLANRIPTAESKDLYSLFKSCSPVGQKLDENETNSSASAIEIMIRSPPPPDSSLKKITESMMNKISRSTLNRHNAEMERELAKMHRETRTSKEDRDKALKESKKNKKDHLARCNAAYYPTSAGDAYSTLERREHGKGVKRPGDPQYNDAFSKKHHCPSLREHRPCMHQFAAASCSKLSHGGNTLEATPTNNVTVNHMPSTYGCQRIETSGITPLPVIPGVTSMYPVYYGMPSSTTPTTSKQECFPSTSGYQPFQPPVPYMVHGHPIPLMYAHPVMYSPANQVYPVQQRLLPQTPITSVGLSTGNYGQPHKSRTRTSDEIADKTDGESSYSSLQSSFFKTDSGSAEDSDQKNKQNEELVTKSMHGQDAMKISNLSKSYMKHREPNSVYRAPGINQVNINKELMYKYQIQSKPLHEVLRADKEKIMTMEQPSLINEQLSQLYLDLHLQGVATRLTLEEGITSSSSSGEENTHKNPVVKKRKYDFNKSVIIHEEDAPLPIPGSGPVAPDCSFDGKYTPSDMAGGSQKQDEVLDDTTLY